LVRVSLRTFADAELSIFSNGVDTLDFGAYFGAEYLVANQASISARVGAFVQDRDPGDTRYEFGRADVSLNFYF
jgi:hypothetical protein